MISSQLCGILSPDEHEVSEILRVFRFRDICFWGSCEQETKELAVRKVVTQFCMARTALMTEKCGQISPDVGTRLLRMWVVKGLYHSPSSGRGKDPCTEKNIVELGGDIGSQ